MAPNGDAVALAPPNAQKLFPGKKPARVVVRGNDWRLIQGGSLTPEQLRLIRTSFQRKRTFCSGRQLVVARMNKRGRFKKTEALVGPVGDDTFRACISKRVNKWRPAKRTKKSVKATLAIQFSGFCDPVLAPSPKSRKGRVKSRKP
jgi:hypothetical protein